MARIRGVEDTSAAPTTRLAFWIIRRRVGRLTDTWRIVALHPWVQRAWGAFELLFERSRLVDAKLKQLAQLKVAALVGCPG